MTRKIVFFQGQNANAVSSNILSTQFKDFTFYIQSSGVTSGANVRFQSQSPIGDWHDIYVQSITSNSKYISGFSYPASQIRAIVSGSIDGGYNVSAETY